MRIELSEILACPRCGPEQGVVLLVDASRGRRVLEGRLGCPECDGRYPVSNGVADLSAGGPERPVGGPSPAGSPCVSGRDEEPELAMETAALLDVASRERPVLLGAGLLAEAPRVAELAQGVEVLVLAPAQAGSGRGAPGDVRQEAAPENLTHLFGAFDGTLPVLSGKLGGVALRAPGPEAVRDGARTLAPGGRLVGLRPDPGLRELLSDLTLRVVASEERAFVLSNEAGARG